MPAHPQAASSPKPDAKKSAPPTLTPALEQTYAAFLKSLRDSRQTVRTYRQGLMAFARLLAEPPKNPSQPDNPPGPILADLAALTDDSLQDFSVWLQEHGPLPTDLRPNPPETFSERTAHTYLAAGLRFVDWLDSTRRMPEGVSSSRIRLQLKVQRGRSREGYTRKPLREQEVPLIVHYFDQKPLPPLADGPRRSWRARLTLLRNRAIVHLLLSTGMRVREACTLKRGAVENKDAMAFVGKGRANQVAHLTEAVQDAVAAYLAERDKSRDPLTKTKDGKPRALPPDEPAFARHDRKPQVRLKAIVPQTVNHLLAQACKALGIRKPVTPHDFRHYFATSLLNEGMPLESVQELLGHKSLLTTRTVYARTRNAVLEDQLATYLPALEEAARTGKPVDSRRRKNGAS